MTKLTAGGAGPAMTDDRRSGRADTVCVLERPRPPGFPGTQAVDREGVVEMGDSCGVQRVAGHGTCEEGDEVVHEVGDDQFHQFLWKPGDWTLWNRDDWALWNPGEWGRRRGGHLQDTSPEGLLDFGLAPPPTWATSDSNAIMVVTPHDE